MGRGAGSTNPSQHLSRPIADGSGSALVIPTVCTVAPLANLSRAEAADQRHLGGLNGGVTSPDEVLLNDGGSGGMVGLENVNGGLAQVAVGKSRQDMSLVPFLHGVHEPLVDKCNVQEGQKNLSWPSIVHGEHEKLVHEPLVNICDVQEGQKHLSWPSVVHGERETVVHEPLVDKCDVQEGQKLISWQSVVHGERAKVVAQTSVVQGGPETEMEQGLLMCSSKWGDSSGDHAKASKIQVGGAATGFPLPFRFSANTAFRESIDPNPGAFISMSPKKTELLEEVGTE
ncbi:hypothetical protein ACOSQ3_005113 [Xanthoceras sorbifolium]